MLKVCLSTALLMIGLAASAYYDGTPGNERYRIASKAETEKDPVIKFLNDLYYQGYSQQIADREAVNKTCGAMTGDQKSSCIKTEEKKLNDAYFEAGKKDGNGIGSSPGTQMGMASSYLEKYRATGELPSFRYIPGAKTYAESTGMQASSLDNKVLSNLNNELASAQAAEKEWLAKMNAKSCRQYWGQGAALAQCEAEQKEIANQVTRAQHRITNTKAAIAQYQMVGYVGAEMQKAANGTGQAPNGYNDQVGADGSGYPWTKPGTASSTSAVAASTESTKLAASNAATTKNAISEEERQRLKENRARISKEAMEYAIELFYGAVAKYAEDEVAKQVLDIESLTSTLDRSVGVVGNHIGKMDQAGGQFDTTNKSVDNQISSKIKALDARVASAKQAVTKADTEMKKYSSCSGGRDAGQSYSECSSKYNQAQTAYRRAQDELRAAERARAAYGEKEQTMDMTQKEGAISDSKNVIKDAEGPRMQSLADGEKLYSAQEKLNRFINDNSKTAVEVAKRAKEVALALLNTKVNNQFKLSDEANMTGMTNDERDLLKRVANEEASQKYIDLFALVGAGAQHFKCQTDSDVECVSYHLMVAASAIYLAAQIRETTDFNLNAADIERTDENPEKNYDEQYKALLRAAKMREELLRTAQARMELQQILQDMLTRVNGIAQLELVAKKTRIAAAEQQVKKAEENLKKVQMSIAIMVGIKVVEELVIKKSLAIAAMNWACCGPHSAGCCATAKKFEALAAKWQTKLAITVAAIAYYGNELIKAQKELKRAKQELANAKKHTHMRCWKEESSTTAMIENLKAKLKNVALMVSAVLMPSAYASDATAIGEQANTGIYKYYHERKMTDAEKQVADYPTPETRATYMQNIVLQVAKHSVDGSEEYMKTFEQQSGEYQKIINNMNQSARVGETGQVLGSAMNPKMKGIDTSKLGRHTVTPGMLDFGSLSQFKVSEKHSANATKSNLDSAKTSSGTVDDSGVGGRKAAANIKDSQKSKAKADETLGKLKNKVSVPGDDSYKKYTREVLERFAQKNPGSRSFVTKAIADLNKASATSSSDIGGKQSAKADDKKAEGQVAIDATAAKDTKTTGNGQEDDAKMVFDEGDEGELTDDQALAAVATPSQCQSEEGKDSTVGCMTEEEKRKGEEALAFLQKQLGSGADSEASAEEKGIYSGKDSLFTQISKRYIKSGLPLLFEKKKK